MDDAELFKSLHEAIRAGQDVALATVISADGSTPRGSGSKMLVYPDGRIEGTVGGGKLEAACLQEARAALAAGRNKKVAYSLTPDGLGMECSGKNEIFIEVFVGRIRLFVLGAGHVGQKIAELATVAGIPYAVADDRSEFANRERFPKASAVHVESPDAALRAARVDEKTYVVIVTRGHLLDKECLEAALKTKAAYIGMIGSKSKVPVVISQLNKKGIHPEKDPRVYAPVGLDISGKSPGEIAVSVMAEILKVSYGRSGKHLRDL